MNFHFACEIIPIRLVLLDGEKIFWFRLKRQRPYGKGKRYLVPYMDEKTNRLVASSKLNQFLKNENLTVEKEEVDLIVSILLN
jgi:hypothetical protein